jgi:hypothetical protein
MSRGGIPRQLTGAKEVAQHSISGRQEMLIGQNFESGKQLSITDLLL